MARHSVVIVDDEYDLLQAVKALLEDEGYTVTGFSSGVTALSYLQEHAAPDVILLDVMMPVISGPEVLERLRAKDGTRAVPVVMMSAVDPPPTVEERATAFLKKPFDIDKLLRTVEKYAR